MLEGTDLNQAYMLIPPTASTASSASNGSNGTNTMSAVNQEPAKPTNRSTMLPKQTVEYAKLAQQAQAQSQQQQKLSTLTLEQQQQLVQHFTQQQDQQPGYFESMFMKKREVLKTLVMAMIVLLAISLHSLIMFWLQDYFTTNKTSFKSELGLRFLYPLSIIFLIWNIKAIAL
jgi:uncharacterized membrane protein YcjF (UPF0283 family)